MIWLAVAGVVVVWTLMSLLMLTFWHRMYRLQRWRPRPPRKHEPGVSYSTTRRSRELNMHLNPSPVHSVADEQALDVLDAHRRLSRIRALIRDDNVIEWMGTEYIAVPDVLKILEEPGRNEPR